MVYKGVMNCRTNWSQNKKSAIFAVLFAKTEDKKTGGARPQFWIVKYNV
jgi:hypothetical protein